MKLKTLNEAQQFGSFSLRDHDLPQYYRFVSKRFDVQITFWDNEDGTVSVNVDFGSDGMRNPRTKSSIASVEIRQNERNSGDAIPRQYVRIVTDVDDVLDRFAAGMESHLGNSDYASLMVPSGIRMVTDNAKAMRNQLVKSIR